LETSFSSVCIFFDSLCLDSFQEFDFSEEAMNWKPWGKAVNTIRTQMHSMKINVRKLLSPFLIQVTFLLSLLGLERAAGVARLE